MARVKKHKKIVREILQAQTGFPTRDFPSLQDILVVDSKEQHFLFLTVGWEKDEFVHDTVYHFEVKDNGEIWIYQSNSTAEIDRELIEKGVDEMDIKMGMLESNIGNHLVQTEFQEQRA